MPELFFDTYAIIETIKGNLSYKKYENHTPILNDFVIAELMHALLKEHDEKTSNEYADKYAVFSAPINHKTIKDAMVFRYKNKQKNLSMVDCIGYFHAKELGIKFLTGDKEFKELSNVQFEK